MKHSAQSLKRMMKPYEYFTSYYHLCNYVCMGVNTHAYILCAQKTLRTHLEIKNLVFKVPSGEVNYVVGERLTFYGTYLSNLVDGTLFKQQINFSSQLEK